jgi:hypothetical protein
MNAGTVAEIDHPSLLLDIPTSLFRSMCVRTGDFEKIKRDAATTGMAGDATLTS